MSRKVISKSRRLVIKVGSALLTNDGNGLAYDRIDDWVQQMAGLRQQGIEIVLVSSGSVAEGMRRLGMKQRPEHLYQIQAAAAVGQMGLVRTYEKSFERFNLRTAQILLTHDDLSDRKRYLNARSTINALLELGVVPIINENDSVVTDEIRFGDNDTLGALVTNLTDADGLMILTDQLGMYDKDPRKHEDAKLLCEAAVADSKLDKMAGGSGGRLGKGGMWTKLRAARLAARSGAFTVIVGGRIEQVLIKLVAKEELGTLLLPSKGRDLSRKQWLAGHLQTKGRLVLDDGAVKVLKQHGRSLLPIGVIKAEGSFRRGEMVSCVDQNSKEIARGLVNYDWEDAQKILRLPSNKIASVLGFVNEPEMIHRDNLVLL